MATEFNPFSVKPVVEEKLPVFKWDAAHQKTEGFYVANPVTTVYDFTPYLMAAAAPVPAPASTQLKLNSEEFVFKPVTPAPYKPMVVTPAPAPYKPMVVTPAPFKPTVMTPAPFKPTVMTPAPTPTPVVVAPTFVPKPAPKPV